MQFVKVRNVLDPRPGRAPGRQDAPQMSLKGVPGAARSGYHASRYNTHQQRAHLAPTVKTSDEAGVLKLMMFSTTPSSFTGLVKRW